MSLAHVPSSSDATYIPPPPPQTAEFGWSSQKEQNKASMKMEMFRESQSINQLYGGIDTSKIVMGQTCPRKSIVRHGVKMNPNGSCPIDGCSYICKSLKQSTFAMHVTRKHQFLTGNSIYTYTCETCYKTFNSRSIMNNHQERAHKKWEFACQEEGCGKVCPNKSSLMIHHVSKHLNMCEADCTDENGFCLNCAKQLTRTGHKNHYARCIGLHERLFKEDQEK